MSLTLAPKSPTEVVNRSYDWSQVLGENDAISNATLTVTSGSIAFANLTWDQSSVYFTISGGTEGQIATLANVITTVAGQTLDETFSIYIEDALVETPFGPSTMTKGDIVSQAFEECGLPDYEFDMSAEEWASSLRKLDLLMAKRPFINLPLGYNFPAILGTSDRADMTGFADTFSDTIGLALAKRIAPTKGKMLSGDTKKAYQQGINDMIAQASQIPQGMLKGNTPLGSGNRYWSIWRPYAYPTWVTNGLPAVYP